MPTSDEHTPSKIPAGASPVGAIPPLARERAVDVLTRHYAADRIGDAELQARLDLVYQATTPAELAAVLADLPAEAPGAAPLVTRQIGSLLSGQEQKLTGEVPRHLRLRATLGYVELDLRDARLQPGVTEIDVHVVTGYVEIHLPPGVSAEVTGRAFLGYFALKGSEPEEDATRIVRIGGRAVMGYAEVYRTPGPALPPPNARRLPEGGEG